MHLSWVDSPVYLPLWHYLSAIQWRLCTKKYSSWYDETLIPPLAPVPNMDKYCTENEITNRAVRKQGRQKKKKNIIRKTICLSLFSSLSLLVCPSVFLSPPSSLSLSSSNNSKIKLHYAPLYWSFGTFRTAFYAGQRRKWLMTHVALIESFLSGQIILTMWPLNFVIAQNGILNSSECYWSF